MLLSDVCSFFSSCPVDKVHRTTPLTHENTLIYSCEYASSLDCTWSHSFGHKAVASWGKWERTIFGNQNESILNKTLQLFNCCNTNCPGFFWNTFETETDWCIRHWSRSGFDHEREREREHGLLQTTPSWSPACASGHSLPSRANSIVPSSPYSCFSLLCRRS